MPEYPSTKRENAVSFAVCVAAGVLLSVLLRHDVFFDLENYHYYNGFAFANDRLGYDVAPAGVHTFFNPLLDFVNWLLIRRLNAVPDAYFALTGFVFGVLLFVCLKINRLFFKSRIAVALSLVLASTGFATWFQIGSSTNEIPVAVLALTALYLMLKDEKTPFAAFLLGAAAGLKLTAATYCLSSAIVFFLFNVKNFKRVALFALCGVCGFLATDGFWAYKLFSLYQNPVFPFLNGVFHSPWFADVNLSVQSLESPDLDRSFPSLLFLPLFLISVTEGDEPTLDHTAFSDFRWLFAFLLAAAYLARRKKIRLSEREKFLALWLFVSYVVWIKAFLVVRYLIPVEMMLPVFFVKAGAAVKPLTGSPVGQAAKLSLCVLAFAVCVGTVWHSERWIGDKREPHVLPSVPDWNVPDGAVFLTLGQQNSAYLAQIAERRDVRIVNRPQYMWRLISKTKWAQAVKDAAESGAVRAVWVTDRKNFVQIDGMTCRVLTVDALHSVCFPADIADGVFGASQPRQ